MDFKLLKQDIKNYWRGVLAAVLACVILDCLFGTCCPMRLITGLPCPACGTTRSFEAVAVLDFRRALWMQPVMPLILGGSLLFFYKRYIRGNADKNFFYLFAAVTIFIAVAVYFYRMYKYYPYREPLEYTAGNLMEILFGHGD